MPHVLRHIDNLVGPPPPPVLVPAGDHEEDHAEYINTTGVGSSEVQDRCEQVILCEPQSVQLCDTHAACLAASVSQGAHISVPPPRGRWGFEIIFLITIN